MREFRCLNSNKVDVLIIDEEGSEYIKYCIPNSLSFSILPIRRVIPWVAKPKFILNFLFHALNSLSIKKAVIFSIISTLNPRILISFIDNSSIMGMIYAKFPEKLCISVQNGSRSGFKWPNAAFCKRPMHTLYGFGDHEYKLLQSEDVNIKEYIAAGSLKYGIYKKYFSNNNEKKYNICYISTYHSNSNTKQYKVLDYYNKQIFKCLVKVCEEFDFSLAVIMKNEKSSQNYTEEVKYYSAIDVCDIADLLENNLLKFKSYVHASNADIVVCPVSTLGFEMYGAGKKTLFGASINDFELAKLWDTVDNFNKLPQHILLDDLNMNSMHAKLNFLLNINDSSYLHMTKKSRLYYMNNMSSIYPDELIQQKIINHEKLHQSSSK